MLAGHRLQLGGGATIGGRYRLLEQLGAGGMGQVYRAHDRLTGQQVALKRVSAPGLDANLLFTGLPGSGGTNLEPRLALAQEFQSLASLRHPNIIGVLDYGFDDQGQPYFTMDLLEGARNVVEAGLGQPRARQVELIMQMLQALVYVHRRGILHRDLKPGNVLLAPGGNGDGTGTVKVLDFGLSVRVERARGTVGTLAYMAPEVLTGEPATPAADLFAVGVMAFEILVGWYPFERMGQRSVLNYYGGAAIDFASLPLDPPLAAILERLLHKDQEKRYGLAHEVIADLSRAVGQPLLEESTATRESFLQAAELVGRDGELSQLVQSLEEAMAGQGGSWLVAGESGVGKSRLLDELRTRALVSGALVLRGQAAQAAGNPYQLWRAALRRLALTTELTELEASVLKALVPDMAALLERPVPDAPELDAKAAQNRLLNVVADVFRRQPQSLVLLLEDLHWAGAESLALLSWLLPLCATAPLLFVASFRDDEQPELAAQLPEMRILKLQRLGPPSVARLSESMLGEAGRNAALLGLLNRETEGNPFFLVEVVRALAEEAGRLDQVARMRLPEHVFTGGLQRLVERRLNQVPASGQPLLRLAAVGGRVLNLPVLQAAGNHQTDLDEWLTTCANAAVLEFREDQWRFTHDKLREGLLQSLAQEESQALHRRMAQAIEVTVPDPAVEAASLAHHWGMAGERAREAHYAVLAGEQALLSGANQEAVTYFSQALRLEGELGRLSAFDLAHLTRRLGEAYLGLGLLEGGQKRLEEALEMLGWPVPASRLRVWATVLRQVARQTLHRLWPARFLDRAGSRRPVFLEASGAYERLSEIYYFYNRVDLFLGATLRAVNLGEQAGPSPELGRAYADLSVAAGTVPLPRLARHYSHLARQVTKAVNEPNSLAWALLLSGVYCTGVGEWAGAAQVLEESVALSQSLGDMRRWEVGLCVRADIHTYQGRFAQSLPLFQRAYPSALSRGDAQSQAWCLLGMLQNQVPLGQLSHAGAEEAMQTVLSLLETEELGIDVRNYAYGVLAACHLRRLEWGQAEAMAQVAAPMMARARPTNFYLFAGYAGTAETLFQLWEQSVAAGGKEAGHYARLAGQALAGLGKYAGIFPIGRPLLALGQGRACWLQGRTEKAMRAWQASYREAERMEMPYDQAMAGYELGRHLPAGDARRDHYLGQAAELFQQAGAVYDAGRARAAAV